MSGICDEELNTGVFDDIWTLFFLSNGLRGGIVREILSPVHGIEGLAWCLFFYVMVNKKKILLELKEIFMIDNDHLLMRYLVHSLMSHDHYDLL